MPRSIPTISPPTNTDKRSLDMLVVEINNALVEVAQAISEVEGFDGQTVRPGGNIDLGGKRRVTGTAPSVTGSDTCNRDELIENALYAVPGQSHRANKPIMADGGVFLKAKRQREPNEAVTRRDIEEHTSGSAAPIGAQYLVLAVDGSLTDERVATAGNGLSATDGGAGGAWTLAWKPGDTNVSALADNDLLQYDSGTGKWVNVAPGTSGVGNVVGPASATDLAIARYDGTTGKLLQDSTVLVGDTGHVLPAVDGSQDLGSSSFAWRSLFTVDATFHGGGVFIRDSTGATQLATWEPTTATESRISASGANTLKIVAPYLTTPQINDTSSDHQYVFAVSELSADRTVTLPLLTGNDTFVFETHAQTLTNKTLTTPTIASFTNATHSHQNAAGGGTLDHGLALTGLTDDDHTQYALLVGRSGGQTLSGSTLTTENLTLAPNAADSTTGKILFGTGAAYDASEQLLLAGTQSATATIDRSTQNLVGGAEFLATSQRTTTASNVLVLRSENDGSGTPAAGFGGVITFVGHDSARTSGGDQMGQLMMVWHSATAGAEHGEFRLGLARSAAIVYPFKWNGLEYTYVMAHSNDAKTTPASGLAALYIDNTAMNLKVLTSAGTTSNTVFADAGASNNFLTAISAAGVISKAQPSAANLSNGTTGTAGTAVVLATSPTITTATLAGATMSGALSANASGTIDIGDATNPFQGIYLAGGAAGAVDGVIYFRPASTTSSDRIYGTTTLGVAQTYIQATTQLNLAVTGSSASGQILANLGVSDNTQEFIVLAADLSTRFKVDGAGQATFSSSTTMGGELVVMDQNDTDQPFFDFQGTTGANATATISTFTTTAGALQGWLQIEVNGTKRWLPFYADPTA